MSQRHKSPQDKLTKVVNAAERQLFKKLLMHFGVGGLVSSIVTRFVFKYVFKPMARHMIKHNVVTYYQYRKKNGNKVIAHKQGEREIRINNKGTTRTVNSKGERIDE